MLLYKTSTPGKKDNVAFTWGGSQTEATKHRVAAKAMGFKPETQTVEVPTNKAGLLEWLNANMTS